MSEITLTLLRYGFLLLFWLFVLVAIGALKKDLYEPSVVEIVTEPERFVLPEKVKASGVNYKLVVVDGESEGEELGLDLVPVSLGRALSCALTIKDKHVSSTHAVIYPSNDKWVIEDNDSSNGTLVNGKKITGPTLLEAGVPIKVGNTILKLQEER